ncbi:uncharacterized protein LOC142764955 isoform X1 [Rhipicephalus microplus]|uniref:uncharacterized protein LOC142764955 isoform X1 n=1 Tax=Rhipicephalus microplus TaxID=6941 RepID=UPI003F6D3BCD
MYNFKALNTWQHDDQVYTHFQNCYVYNFFGIYTLWLPSHCATRDQDGAEQFWLMMKNHLPLFQFYSNNSIIWTVNTTVTTKKRCIVDLVNQTTNDYTNFTRRYRWGEQQVSNEMDGVFYVQLPARNSSYYNAMRVSVHGQPPSSNETLQFVDSDYTCGIFSVVFYGNAVYFDIRVKNTTIEKPDRECIEKFRELSFGTITTVYEKNCTLSE